MKFKRIISAVSAFAMAMSLITVANAASLGGKPSVTATFDGYEKVSDTTVFAFVNITLDMSAAETLEAYSYTSDETTDWEDVITGNGISTMGIPFSEMSGFTYNKGKSTIPEGLTVKTTSISYGPKDNAEDYWVTPVTTVRLAYKVTDFDSKGTFTIDANQVSVSGKDSATGEVWQYKSLDNQITVSSCSIPSYNEWSTPVGPTGPTATAAGTSADGKITAYTIANDAAGDVDATEKVITKTFEGLTITDATRVYVTIDGENRVFGSDLAEATNGLDIGKLTFGIIVNANVDLSKITEFDVR